MRQSGRCALPSAFQCLTPPRPTPVAAQAWSLGLIDLVQRHEVDELGYQVVELVGDPVGV